MLGIAETWCDEHTSEGELTYPGYTTLRSDRQDGRVGGGVAMLLRSDIQYEIHEVAVPQPVDVLDLLVHLPKMNLRVVLVYRPPMSSPEGDRGLYELVSAVANGRNRFIVMGDFNLPSIDWEVLRAGSGQLESQLVNLCQTTPLHQVVRFPTRFREGNRPSVLDLAFVQRPEEVRDIECLPPLGNSDHCVIGLSLNTAGLDLPPPRWIKQYHKVDASAVMLQARALDWLPHDGDDAESIWTRVKANINLLDNLLVPWVKIDPTRKPRWMTPAVRRARDEKRRSWAAWRKFSTAENWVRYRSDRNRLKAVIRRAQVAADVRLSNNMGQGNRRFFAHLNHFRVARKSIQRIKKADGSDTTDLWETAEPFSEAYRNAYKANDHRHEPMVEARQQVN